MLQGSTIPAVSAWVRLKKPPPCVSRQLDRTVKCYFGCCTKTASIFTQVGAGACRWLTSPTTPCGYVLSPGQKVGNNFPLICLWGQTYQQRKASTKSCWHVCGVQTCQQRKASTQTYQQSKASTKSCWHICSVQTCQQRKQSETKMTASILKQDPRT